jgi:hypothetical protein
MNGGHPDQERQGQVPAFLVQSHGLVSDASLVLSDHSTTQDGSGEDGKTKCAGHGSSRYLYAPPSSD